MSNTQDQSITVVQINDEWLIDSRVLAKNLNYDHESIVRSVKRHQDRLEKKSILRHRVGEIKGRGQPEKYYMLDERQALIVTGSLKKGEEADEWHDKLVDAFLEARNRIKELEKNDKQKQPLFNHRYEERLRLNSKQRHFGYFPIMKLIDDICVQFREDLFDFSETSSPDISLGKMIASWLKDQPFYDEDLVQHHDMVVYVRNGIHVMRECAFYPFSWYAPIEQYASTYYFPVHFPRYISGKYKGVVRVQEPEERQRITERVNYFVDKKMIS